MGLTPGSYEVRISPDGYLRRVIHFKLEGPPQIIRKDFYFEKARFVDLYLKSEKGQSIKEIFKKHIPKGISWVARREITPMATERPFPNWLPPSTSPVPAIEGGYFAFHREKEDKKPRSPFYYGSFQLPPGKPFWVHVFHRNKKILSRPLPLSMKRLDIVFKESSLFEDMGKIRLQVLEEETLKEPKGVQVRLFDRNRNSSPLRLPWTHNQKNWEVSVFPGIYVVEVKKPGFLTFNKSLRVQPRHTIDLGQIILQKGFPGFIKVLLPDQTPFRGMAEVRPLDPTQRGLPAPPFRHLLISVKGLPLKGLVKGLNRVIIQDKDHYVERILDLTNGPPKNLSLTLAKDRRIEARFENHLPENPLLFSLLDKRGFLFREWPRLPRGSDRNLPLPVGSYTLLVYDGWGKQLRKVPIQARAQGKNIFVIR